MSDVIILTSDRTAPVIAAMGLGLSPVVITAERYRHLHESVAPTRSVRDASSVDAVLLTIREVISDSGPVPILAATEKTIPIAGIARTVLGLPGMTAETAVVFTSKSAMKARWDACGIPTAASRRALSLLEIEDHARALGLPAVVKPTFGAGGFGTTVVRDLADLDWGQAAVMVRQTGVTVESLLAVDAEYCVDSVVRDGRVVGSWVSSYFFPLLGATHRGTAGSYLRKDSEVAHIRDFSARVVAALGIADGVTHFECFDVAGTLHAGEIACRPAGGGVPDVLMRARGVDLWEEFVRAGMGMSRESLPAPEPDSTHGWMFFPRAPEFVDTSSRPQGLLSVREDAPGGAIHVLNLEADAVPDMVMLHRSIAQEV